MNSLKIFTNGCIAQTEQGLFINDIPFLPATIQSITPHYHFISYSSFRKEYEIELIETASIFPSKSLILHYDPNRPMDFLKDLNSYGLKSNLLIKDSIETWNLIVEGQKNGILEKRALLSSDHCGWILFEDNLYYMTSQFAICKSGLIQEYRCTSPNACLLYDPEMEPSDAFVETMRLINLDFNETMPILVSQILSFLHPVAESQKLYSIPGLFLSGPTSTGKTELAFALGTLFGNPVTKDVQNFLILQTRPKDFERRQMQFSDTTFILDDARKSPSQSVRESIKGVIDRFGRSAFAGNNTRLLPIVTGEPQVLNEHLPSLRNRFIEVYLNPSEQSMAARKALIKASKDNPLPLRSCLLDFIKYLCKNFRSAQFSRDIARIKEEFSNSFEEQIYRTDDNIFMYYLGFRLFMSYGKNLNCLTYEEQKKYIENYKETLANISQNSALYSEEGQIHTLVRFLCHSIKSKRLQIYTPEIQTCYYRSYYHDGYDSTNDTYGHFSIIDISHGFNGIYIKDRMALPGYPHQSEDLPVLIINTGEFFEALHYEMDTFKQAHGYEALPPKEGALKKMLARKGLLYTESRYEDDYCNYTCKYPHWINESISCESSLCINMKSPYAKDLILCIESLEYKEFPYDCLYESCNSPLRLYDLTGFNNLSGFKQY